MLSNKGDINIEKKQPSLLSNNSILKDTSASRKENLLDAKNMFWWKMKINVNKLKKILSGRPKIPKTKQRVIKLKKATKIQSIMEQHNQFF